MAPHAIGKAAEAENLEEIALQDATAEDPRNPAISQIVACLTSLEPLRPDVVRAVPAYVPLRAAGRILRRIGAEDKAGNYAKSSPTLKISEFWSHSWHGAVWSKVLMLLVMNNGLASLCVGTLGGALLVSAFWAFGPAQDPGDPLDAMLATLLFSLMCCALTLIFWRRGQSVFMDQLCIHQADMALKTAGLISMPAILKCSSTMVVCWDSTYVQRAWCVFEMAAFMKAHGEDAKLVIRPTFLGPCSMAFHAGLAGIMAVNLATFYFATDLDTSAMSMLRLALILLGITGFMFVAVSSFRKYHMSVKEMVEQLRDFSVHDAVACCCTQGHLDSSGNPIPLCDKEIILECILSWFGSVEVFNQRVQKQMQSALVPQLGHLSFSYSWMAACSIPVFWTYMARFMYFAFEGAWSDCLQAFFFTLAWWLGATPIMAMSILSVSRALARRRSLCCSLLTNLLASWVVLPIYIGIELWMRVCYSLQPGLPGVSISAGSLIVLALLLAALMSWCARRAETS